MRYVTAIIGVMLLMACTPGRPEDPSITPTYDFSQIYQEEDLKIFLTPRMLESATQDYSTISIDQLLFAHCQHRDEKNRGVGFPYNRYVLKAQYSYRSIDARRWKIDEIEFREAVYRAILGEGDQVETATQVVGDTPTSGWYVGEMDVIFEREMLFSQNEYLFWVLVTTSQEAEISALSSNGEQVVLFFTLFAAIPESRGGCLLLGLDDVMSVVEFQNRSE